MSGAPTIDLPQPYLLFLGNLSEPPYAKTAYGLRDWARERCVGEYGVEGYAISAGLPRLTPAEARRRGARSVVIGIASRGGALEPDWIPALLEALECGLDLISGMHSRLKAHPALESAAARLGRRLIDVREPPRGISVGTGCKRTGKRLLAVGTDCAVGKKYTALSLARAFSQRGLAVDFRATGQTGIIIAGGGIPMDAVVSDFVSGAAELLSPDAPATHWDVVEGQGSIFHPSYAGVSLGLLHGTQPDVIVVCHEAGRERLLGLEHHAIAPLEETIAQHLALARRTNPRVRCAGLSLNTSRLSESDAQTAISELSKELGLPVADPVRGGVLFDRLVDACLDEGCGADA